MRCLGLVACIAGCKVAPPPPLIPMHTDTAANPRGETTVMIVVGFATQGFNDGLGLALRVEHQQTDRTTLGLELAGGRGVALSGAMGLFGAPGFAAITAADAVPL